MYKVFTDGSWSPKIRNGGWAAVFYKAGADDEDFEYIAGNKEATTNNIMELWAIGKALRWLLDNNATGVIYCDSKYAVESLLDNYEDFEKRNFLNVKNAKLLVSIKNLMKEVEEKFGGVELLWVKGHAGLKGNEIADRLAKAERRALDAETKSRKKEG